MVDPRAGSPKHVPSAAGGAARLAYASVMAAGIAPDPLLRQARLTRPQMENPRARVSARSQIEFLNLAAAALNDDLLGFHLAQAPDLRQIGLLYYVAATSDTLIEALRRAARYTSIVNEGVTQECIEGAQVGMALRYVGVSRHLDRHHIEFWITVLVRLCRALTGLEIRPSRVRLTHLRKRGSTELTEFFGRRVEFGAAADEVLFSGKLGRSPIVGADPYLNQLLVSYCEDALAMRSGDPGSFRPSVENAIVPLLPHGRARVPEVARRLGVSQRTFARRLSAERLTFSRVLESLRRDLAARYLADPDLLISEIAWLLGYQEVAAFSHAFKRWTGRTPRAARAIMPTRGRYGTKTTENAAL